MAEAVGWVLIMDSSFSHQLDAEGRVRKLKEELKLEKDIKISITLLALGLAEIGRGRQGGKVL